jgi:hypothetical protein
VRSLAGFQEGLVGHFRSYCFFWILSNVSDRRTKDGCCTPCPPSWRSATPPRLGLSARLVIFTGKEAC